MIDRKPFAKPTAARPRAALGNLSNKTAPAAKTDVSKVMDHNSNRVHAESDVLSYL